MSYSIPQMPLLFAVWSNADDPTTDPPRDFDIPCNLGWGRRGLSSSPGFVGSGTAPALAQLLVPAGTDIRGMANQAATDPDWVEVPQGSGRYYIVWQVDDIGKGFPNEHRFGLISPLTAIGWPVPYP